MKCSHHQRLSHDILILEEARLVVVSQCLLEVSLEVMRVAQSCVNGWTLRVKGQTLLILGNRHVILPRVKD